LALVALAGCATAALAQQPLTETIVAQGDSASGPTVNYSIINVLDLGNEANIPSVNGSRQVVFRTDLSGNGTTSTTNVGLVGGTIGATTLLAREGGTASGQPAGVNWSDFTFPRINDAGTIAFTSTLVGAGVTSANNEGIWRGPLAGPYGIVALRGGSAGITGVPAAVFNDIFAETVRLNSTGTLGFFATLTGAGVLATADRGLWLSSPAGVLTTVAIENDQAPGVIAGVLFSDFTDPSSSEASSMVLGASTAAWISTLRGTGVSGTNDVAAFARDLNTGTNTLLMREGDSAATLITGATWGAPGAISVGADGSIVTRNLFTGVATAVNTALVKWNAGVPAIAVRKGDAAPGLTGVTFSDLLSGANLAPKVNASGDTFFLGVLTGTGVVTANNQLLCVKPSAGPVAALLRRGEALPGALAGVVINVISSFSVNSAGEVIVACTVSGTGVTTGNDNVVLALVPGRPPRVLTREGDSVSVGGGTMRTMNTSGITLTHNGGSSRNNGAGTDGLRAGLGSDGTFVYRAYFTDGSARLLALDVNTYPCTDSDVAGTGQTIGYNGELSADDIIVFVNWFFASDPRADVAGAGQTIGADGNWSADDIIVFINRFFTGC
jgi:hypothetical protein